MTELPYPELQFATLELRADPPTTVLPTGFRYRARSESATPDSLKRRVKFGGPLAVPLDAAGVHSDPDLLTFMKQSDAGWQLIHSAVTFDSKPDDPRLETAKVQLNLRTQAGAGAGAGATAWSMLPQSASTPYETVDRYSIEPTLQLASFGGSLGSTEHGKTRHGEDVYLRAGGLFTSEPVWNFERTATVSLDGSHRLVMIARAPKGTRARLSVMLAASVKTGRLPGLFKRTIELHGAPGPTIELEF